GGDCDANCAEGCCKLPICWTRTGSRLKPASMRENSSTSGTAVVGATFAIRGSTSCCGGPSCPGAPPIPPGLCETRTWFTVRPCAVCGPCGNGSGSAGRERGIETVWYGRPPRPGWQTLGPTGPAGLLTIWGGPGGGGPRLFGGPPDGTARAG